MQHNYLRSPTQPQRDPLAVALVQSWRQTRRQLQARGENRIAWHGVMTKLNQVSDASPQGAYGHKVFICGELTQSACHQLIGMPLNCSNNLTKNQKDQVIGTIRAAEVAGDDLRVSGFLWSKNQPELIRRLQANMELLGMFFEIGEAETRNQAARVWELVSLEWTGTTVLLKAAGAFHSTSFTIGTGVPI